MKIENKKNILHIFYFFIFLFLRNHLEFSAKDGMKYRRKLAGQNKSNAMQLTFYMIRL
jgi:hypothetical protein